MSLCPEREAFHEAVAGHEDGRPVVARVSVPLDTRVTPVAAYAALSGRTADVDPADDAFLLESAGKTPSSDPDGAFRPTEGTRHARYSFVGYDPAAVVTVTPSGTDVETLDPRYEGALSVDDPDVDGTTRPDALDRLRAALPDVRLSGFETGDRQRLDGGLVGVLSYDAVYDTHLAEVGVDRPSEAVPDARFVLATRVLAFDHREDTAELVFTPLLRAGDDPDTVYDRLEREADRVRRTLDAATDPDPGGVRRRYERAGDRETYEESVRRAKKAVLDGEVYQCVVSRSRELYGEVDSLGLYAALREVNPSPYMYLLDFGDRAVIGASPETLVSVNGDRVVSHPLAGTCPRGASPVEDRRLAGEMLADGKERAEHTMLVDLARNDVRQVSASGSVRVEEFMTVLKYSHVQHIESTVTGRLRADRDAFDATRAAFPAGTLTGAPKVRAMELIDELEHDVRGLYGGGVGYYGWTGDADVAIVIRTAVVDHGVDLPAAAAENDTATTDRVTVRAGAGIVADSDPGAEFEETEAKMDGVLAAIRRVTEAPAPSADGGTPPPTTTNGDGDGGDPR
jgi:anthranilate synthase component 1